MRDRAHWRLYVGRLLLLVCFFLSWFAPLAGGQQTFSDRLALSTDSVAPRRFVAVHGRRSVIMGYPERGLEVWAYPFQILSDYQVGFLVEGSATETDGRRLLRRVIYRPDRVTRIYIGADYIVRETLFVPLDRPAAIVSYEVESRKSVDIAIHFAPVLNLMWPGAIGGQYAEWNQGLPGYVLSEPTQRFSAAIASPEIISHDSTVNSAVRTDGKLSFMVRPHAAAGGGSAEASVYVAMQPEDSKGHAAVIRDLAAHRAELESQAEVHYAELEHNSLRILTPDEDVNHALEWAETALDQAWVCNPQLGCGIVGGYGPSRDARRPQYDWFFAGDGLVATNALISAGEYSRAREELEFIAKYQDQKTGMVWHELSQSAGLLDWTKYPYMFVHVDITFDYLNGVERYVAASGDTTYAVEHWPSIAAAYQYCQSLIHSSDYLPHIPAGKEGGNEQERPDDDLGLSASWVAATESFAELARQTGHVQLVGEALKANQLARASIAALYWDATHKFWIDAHTQSGNPIFDWRRGPTQAIVANIFSSEENAELLNKLASADFRTDWGMRGVAASSSIFNPESYATGSVFALSTADAATTFWREHRPAIAFSTWSAILPWNTLDSLGHIHEVLAGNYYREQTESVPEQTWSSAGLLDAAVQGMLGLDIQGSENRIVFMPHLPADWTQTSVENIHLPHSTLAFIASQNMNGVDLEVKNDGAPVKLVFEPQVPNGADRIKAEFDGHTIPAAREELSEDEHVKVEVEAPSGVSHCHIQFVGGVSVIGKRTAPPLGDSSTGMKMTDLHLQNRTLFVDADVNAKADATFVIQTPWKIGALKGVTIRPLPNLCYEVKLQPSSEHADSLGYAPTHAEITFAEK